ADAGDAAEHHRHQPGVAVEQVHAGRPQHADQRDAGDEREIAVARQQQRRAECRERKHQMRPPARDVRRHRANNPDGRYSRITSMAPRYENAAMVGLAKMLTIACVKPNTMPTTSAPTTEPGPPMIMIAKAVTDIVQATVRSTA